MEFTERERNLITHALSQIVSRNRAIQHTGPAADSWKKTEKEYNDLEGRFYKEGE